MEGMDSFLGYLGVVRKLRQTFEGKGVEEFVTIHGKLLTKMRGVEKIIFNVT